MTAHRLVRSCGVFAAVAFAAAAGAQTGRIVVQLAPAVTGQSASFQLQYPLSLAGTYYMMLFSMPPLNAAVPAPIPGFNVVGLLRVDPATAAIVASNLLDATGRTAPWSVAIPNNTAFVGQQFDVQTLDINLLTNTLTFSDNDVTATIAAPFVPSASLNLVAIPAGTFQMGSATSGSLALPVHQVQITRPFWLGKYEVTQAEFRDVMGFNTSPINDPIKPVAQMSWQQAVTYCAELTRREAQAGRLPAGYVYRLPTEAEWEYACRAGTATSWNTGASIACAQANFSGCVGQVWQVGGYAANAFGLHDMHGNIAEWVLDGASGVANYPSAAVTDPYVVGGTHRIVRGGGFNNAASDCQSATRSMQLANQASFAFGFRVALAPVLVEPSLGMVAIAPGSFVQGDNNGPTLPFYNGVVERPAHVTSLTQPFWIGKHEVTQAQYQALMNANPSASVGPNKPVEQVTWQQARAYCDALTAREGAAGRLPWGYEYRLPTEAEWEYCCRAGTTTAYHTGATIGCAQANLFDPALGSCVGQTAAVGSYTPNAWGLHDMHGNVREFCLDAWNGTAGYVATPLADPLLVSGSYRIDRGGSYASLTMMGRSAFRSSMLNGLPSAQVGFRVVLAPSLAMPKLASAPASTFAMGSTAGSIIEQPVRQVTISPTVALGSFEVTQAQYFALMGANPSYFQSATDPTASQRPVEQVSWAEAAAFCAKLTQLEHARGRLSAGEVYRLPTEAEWELACRAGSTTEWHTGASLTSAQANISTAWARTTTVGSYPANALGFFDMHGNVAEWCLDGYAPYVAGAATNPYVEPVPGSSVVARGGGWLSIDYASRSAFRDPRNGTGVSSVGFRVARARFMPSPSRTLVAINPGTFQMGSTAGSADEQPVRQVTLSRPFWIGKYEVTQAEVASAYNGYNPSYFQGSAVPAAAQRPVEQVDWVFACQYCVDLTNAERAAGRMPPGYEYRLPTEAEWEYCCRAGTTTEWHTGGSLSTTQANFAGVLATPAFPQGQTAIAGSYASNAWGIHDMHGNVGEWCLDLYGPYAAGPVTNPFPYFYGAMDRVVRGGNWANFCAAGSCRSARRGSGYLGDSDLFTGFRVVLAPIISLL